MTPRIRAGFDPDLAANRQISLRTFLRDTLGSGGERG